MMAGKTKAIEQSSSTMKLLPFSSGDSVMIAMIMSEEF
jgi:hypothetical protein